jgi:hypothetical protein
VSIALCQNKKVDIYTRAALILATTLGFTFFSSIFSTIGLLGLYMLYRLGSIVRSSHRQGSDIQSSVILWTKEMQTTFNGSNTHAPGQGDSSNANPVVTKPDGTQDGQATVAKHRQLQEEHVRKLEESHQNKLNSEQAVNANESSTASPTHKAQDNDSSPVVTKPDGTQDGPATIEKHRQLQEAHARRLEEKNGSYTNLTDGGDAVGSHPSL